MYTESIIAGVIAPEPVAAEAHTAPAATAQTTPDETVTRLKEKAVALANDLGRVPEKFKCQADALRNSLTMSQSAPDLDRAIAEGYAVLKDAGDEETREGARMALNAGRFLVADVAEGGDIASGLLAALLPRRQNRDGGMPLPPLPFA